MGSLKLGVNLDHVATLRQARYDDDFFNSEPDLIESVKKAVKGGADSITLHLREDRRHIQDRDLFEVKENFDTPLNLEMANVPEMVDNALKVMPEFVCMVPEKREELTTEGGLNIIQNFDALKATTDTLRENEIIVSLFIDPDLNQIDSAASCGANAIELHTGKFANSSLESDRKHELERLISASKHAMGLGLKVNAGHGINSTNVTSVLTIPNLSELNVGHHLISNSIFVGIEKSVSDFKKIISSYNILEF